MEQEWIIKSNFHFYFIFVVNVWISSISLLVNVDSRHLNESRDLMMVEVYDSNVWGHATAENFSSFCKFKMIFLLKSKKNARTTHECIWEFIITLNFRVIINFISLKRDTFYLHSKIFFYCSTRNLSLSMSLARKSIRWFAWNWLCRLYED